MERTGRGGVKHATANRKTGKVIRPGQKYSCSGFFMNWSKFTLPVATLQIMDGDGPCERGHFCSF
jgi:hypothetical protein